MVSLKGIKRAARAVAIIIMGACFGVAIASGAACFFYAIYWLGRSIG